MKLLNQESGFTVIEAVVAQVVLIIGSLAIWSVFVAGSRFNAEAENRTVATSIAQLKMEEVMNTRFRYIVEEHPAGETMFENISQGEEPYWTLDSNEEWKTSLPEGKYAISYFPDENADPLGVKLIISWHNHLMRDTSIELETLVSMTPGRFRQ